MFNDIFSSIKQFFNPEMLSPLADKQKEEAPRQIQIPPPASRRQEEKMQPYRNMMSRAQEPSPSQEGSSSPGNFIEMIKRLLGSEQTRELRPRPPQPTPSTIRAVKTTYPTSTPTVTPTPERTTQPIEGRSDKFRKISEAYPENYQKLLDLLDQSDANDVEKQLAIDVAAQESMFDPVRKASKHGFLESTSSGLFQFNNGTWRDYLDVNPEAKERGASKDNPADALEAFLWTIRKGIKGQGLSKWDASKDVWGPSYSDEELQPFYHK